jgi:hypothetical protein
MTTTGPLHLGPRIEETLLLQQVLAETGWAKKLTDEDRRGLTALFWGCVSV